VPRSAGPVVALHDGTVLVDPTNAEMGAALGVDVRPAEQPYDVTVVGAGPAGLAAAVYGASEGLRVALLEREAFGGPGTSSLIRNYWAFRAGSMVWSWRRGHTSRPGCLGHISSTATRRRRWQPTAACASLGCTTEVSCAAVR
jgi:hypothetical protein